MTTNSKFQKKTIRLSIILLFVMILPSLSACDYDTVEVKPTPEKVFISPGDILYQSDQNRDATINIARMGEFQKRNLNLQKTFVQLAWGQNNGRLFGLSQNLILGDHLYPFRGYPAYLSDDGDVEVCKLDLFEGIYPKGNFDGNEIVFGIDARGVYEIDLTNCALVREIAKYDDINELQGVSYNPVTGELIVGVRYSVSLPPAEGMIMRVDLESGETTGITYGINPAWTPTMDAFTLIRYDGIYLRTRDGKETQLVELEFDDYCYLPYPRPFPGGVIYHYENLPTNPATIFIYYYETNEVENTGLEGLYPVVIFE